MKLSPVVLKLRLGETRFENQIVGVAELGEIMKRQLTLQADTAFVVQLAEIANKHEYDSTINQKVKEVFAVVVALANDSSDRDKTGLTAYDLLHDTRQDLWDLLIGWQMPDAESLVYYVGGRVLDINPAYLWYQFEFGVDTRVCPVRQDVSGMDDFNTIYAEYILAPDEDNLPVSGGNPLLPRDDNDVVDMIQNIDLTE